MKRFSIKKMPRKGLKTSKWKIKSSDGWEYFEVPSIDGLKVITKPNWNFYIVFVGKIEPFEVYKDKDRERYYTMRNPRFANGVLFAYKDAEGFYHIKTEAGTFKVRFNAETL